MENIEFIDSIYKYAAEYLNTVLPEAGRPIEMFSQPQTIIIHHDPTVSAMVCGEG